MNNDFRSEFQFIASRSSGAGGQNVNKVSTKVMLLFNVGNSVILDEKEKTRIHEKLANQINSEGYLQIVSQEERTQLGNKEKCIEKFYVLIKKALTIPKKRRKTRPSTSSIEKRLETKRKVSEQKQYRKRVEK